MRPANVTDEDIAEWEAARQDFINDGGEENSFITPPPEVWYSGEWLMDQLIALNCTKEIADKIVFATGQRQAYSTDHWQTAVDALENYKKGIWDEPGEELALRLVKERFGENPDPLEVFKSTLNQDGADPEKLLEFILRHHLNNVIKKKP